MRFLFISAGVFLCLITQAQENLVPNGSFEEIADCPPMIAQWVALDWQTITFTPDIFHLCSPINVNSSANAPNNIFGYQLPYNGDAYAGISTFTQNPQGHEHIQTLLTEPLTAGIRYLIGFQSSPADRAQYAISTLGAALTSEPPEVITVDWPNGMVDALPQVMLDDHIPITDTAKWVLICDTVLAQGGERYLTIGNFNLDGDSDTLRFNPNHRSAVRRQLFPTTILMTFLSMQ